MFAIQECANLTSIEASGFNFSFENGALFNYDKTTLITYLNSNKAEHYDIPESVISVKECAFLNCLEIASITIHNNIKVIEVEAFGGCR